MKYCQLPAEKVTSRNGPLVYKGLINVHARIVEILERCFNSFCDDALLMLNFEQCEEFFVDIYYRILRKKRVQFM